MIEPLAFEKEPRGAWRYRDALAVQASALSKADAIGEVFATGDISKVMEENARLIATVAALKAADAERAEGLAKVQGYRADAEARVRELEEALEPFADFGDFMESETEEFADLDRMNLTPEESECVLGNLFVGAFRRARSLLSRED